MNHPEAVVEKAKRFEQVLLQVKQGREPVALCNVDVLQGSLRAWIHSRHQDEVGREGQRSAGAADGDDPILQRLAQRFQVFVAELRQFVQQQATEPIGVRLWLQPISYDRSPEEQLTDRPVARSSNSVRFSNGKSNAHL